MQVWDDFTSLNAAPVDVGQQTPWRFQLAFNKRLVQNQLGSFIRKLRLPPAFDLPL